VLGRAQEGERASYLRRMNSPITSPQRITANALPNVPCAMGAYPVPNPEPTTIVKNLAEADGLGPEGFPVTLRFARAMVVASDSKHH
jgi:hypothetical protein